LALALYLIGTPGAGKSTVFDALTNTPQGTHFSTKGQHRLGSVKVPDERLEQLRDLYRPKKYTPTEINFVDVGLPPGAQEQRSLGELTTFLGDADAFLLVLQGFGEFDYRGDPVDPKRQLDAMALELVVADLEKVERRLERLLQETQKGNKGSGQEADLLTRCKTHLEAEGALRTLDFSEEQDKLLRGFQFLSQKPVLVVLNVEEGAQPSQEIEAACQAYGFEQMAFCATVEAEIAQLEIDEQRAFLADYGIQEAARPRLIRAAYRLLHLVSFFTVGEDEVRAWTIQAGTPAQLAAGKIHSDIERGFIRAETVHYADLIEQGAWSKCRDQALLRLEGKTYPVQDGDVINFRFNT